MNELDTFALNCPYCGSNIELVIDLSVGTQEYSEDCEVCCRPMVVSVHRDRGGEFSVTVRSEGE